VQKSRADRELPSAQGMRNGRGKEGPETNDEVARGGNGVRFCMKGRQVSSRGRLGSIAVD
jgi:hypothetical protein